MGVVGALFLALLLASGALSVVLATGLAVVHWALHHRPYLDAGGWAMVAYGSAALAAWDALTGNADHWTAGWVAAATFAAFAAGRRTCGQWVALVPVVPPHLRDPEDPEETTPP